MFNVGQNLLLSYNKHFGGRYVHTELFVIIKPPPRAQKLQNTRVDIRLCSLVFCWTVTKNAPQDIHHQIGRSQLKNDHYYFQEEQPWDRFVGLVNIMVTGDQIEAEIFFGPTFLCV